MDQIPTVSICSECETYICQYSLISGKKYSVNTHLDRWKGTIKGTFSRYEKNKLIGKDEPVWSIVFMDWWGMDLDTEENPCQTQLYLDPIEDLKFYEI
jgi:hypothetical protein